ILNLVCGFGPLQDLLALPNTSEIMVVHKDLIYIERDGRLQRLHRTFISDDILVAVIQRIVEPLGRRIDRSTPLVDARLPDGSRVNAIIPPLAIKGPCLTIRRFSKDPLSVEDLIGFGSLTSASAAFLKACVAAHKNVIISGGTGSGKTVLLNILSSFVGRAPAPRDHGAPGGGPARPRDPRPDRGRGPRHRPDAAPRLGQEDGDAYLRGRGRRPRRGSRDDERHLRGARREPLLQRVPAD